MQASFKKVAFIEGEMQQDFERYLYDPFFSIADLETSLKSYGGENTKLDSTQVNKLINNQSYKNGFVLSSFNSESLINEYSILLSTTNELISLINQELNK